MGKVFGIYAKLRTINFPPTIIVPSMALSLAQIIPQALLPEPTTGMCNELAIKQQDPKASPLCQRGFQAELTRLKPYTQKGEACLTGGLQPFRSDRCSLFLLYSHRGLQHIHM